jgi:hypothetical protein
MRIAGWMRLLRTCFIEVPLHAQHQAGETEIQGEVYLLFLASSDHSQFRQDRCWLVGAVNTAQSQLVLYAEILRGALIYVNMKVIVCPLTSRAIVCIVLAIPDLNG